MASTEYHVEVAKKRGKPEGAALTAPSVGLGYGLILRTAIDKPKYSPFWFYKTAPSSVKLSLDYPKVVKPFWLKETAKISVQI